MQSVFDNALGLDKTTRTELANNYELIKLSSDKVGWLLTELKNQSMGEVQHPIMLVRSSGNRLEVCMCFE